MPAIVKCTDRSGDVIFINFDHVAFFNRSGNETMVMLSVGQHPSRLIRETPEELVRAIAATQVGKREDSPGWPLGERLHH